MELHTAAEPDIPYAQQGSGTVQVHGGWTPSTGPIPVTDPGLSGSSHPVNPIYVMQRERNMIRVENSVLAPTYM